MIEMEQKIDKAIAVARSLMASRATAEDIQKVAQSVLNLSNVKLQSSILETMEEVDDELVLVLGRIRPSVSATELVQLTQAALNITNAVIALTGKQKPKKQGAGA